MPEPLQLRIYLHQAELAQVRRGRLNFVQKLRTALEARGWQTEVLRSGERARRQAPDLPGYALYYMEKPTHDRALTFRRSYHFPFWRIEAVAERWRWPVAQMPFGPQSIDPDQARDFAARLAARVLPGPKPQRGDHVLIPLQGRIREARSFQTISPLQMVARVAETGRPAHATLHPKEEYSSDDIAALNALATRYPNLTIGGETRALLRNCAFVATQNSAVAFDGYILGKPAVLFAQVDFHHIGLNVADMGVAAALAAAPDYRPDFARYLFWFLQQQSINMSGDHAEAKIIAALRRCGWPVQDHPSVP